MQSYSIIYHKIPAPNRSLLNKIKDPRTYQYKPQGETDWVNYVLYVRKKVVQKLIEYIWFGLL